MEYKFRGKSKRTNEWVTGSYHYCDQIGTMRSVDYKDGNRVVEDKAVTFNSHWILVHQTPDTIGWDIRDTFIPHEVYPESVGQFTGLKDQFGNEIFGSDILIAVQAEQRKDDTGYEVYDVVNESRGGFNVFGKAMQGGYTKDNNVLYQFMWCNPGSHGSRDYYYQLTNIEVVGNRHDSPDYLLNPLQRSSVTNTMNNNIDPKEGQEEVKEQPADAVAPAEQATEESAEEGTTEG